MLPPASGASALGSVIANVYRINRKRSLTKEAEKNVGQTGDKAEDIGGHLPA